jgi:ABC-type dipeptide/oligopeptide/nickel transport system permease component
MAWWAIGHGLIERPGWFALPDQASAVRTGLAVAILGVGSGALSEVHAEVEDALVRLRSSPWVDAARARGAATWPLILRGLIAPLAATVANRTALLVGGAVVIEKLLLLRGAGAILWDAAVLRDYDLALSIAVLAAALVAGSRLGADLVRIAADPRLREAR